MVGGYLFFLYWGVMLGVGVVWVGGVICSGECFGLFKLIFILGFRVCKFCGYECLFVFVFVFLRNWYLWILLLGLLVGVGDEGCLVFILYLMLEFIFLLNFLLKFLSLLLDWLLILFFLVFFIVGLVFFVLFVFFLWLVDFWSGWLNKVFCMFM